MSTTTTTQSSAAERSFIDRLRASKFLTELFANRLAVFGLSLIVGMVLIAIFARLTYDLDALTRTQLSTNPTLESPTAEFWFGTDKLGRDIFPRVLYGAWFALKYGTVAVLASTVLGIAAGTVAAYYSDITDNVIMRTMDILLSFPALLLALALITIFPESWGLWRAVAALTLVYTPRFARVVRGAALKVLEDEYIDATEALGANDARVLVRHVIPNCLAPITVQSTLNFGLAIIDIAALSFLGFGASPGDPSWGMMLNEGVKDGLYLDPSAWWWSFFPGLFLALTVLGFNLLGDGMRDALDPRMRETV
ncbi:binding-protein-dependent transport systems inner membrane component [Halovivax asiaticus JCM 14624]|uniref:Binding-protein-dependent transport systems inner membrane component n=1 Tax=Halovivax asiaticus JCM 14624 TaxID=1227490 RepID=M0BDI9_9EURY|nr:ABC transporter permease subunit [Halovivax asiaticus]ELZ08527.1 binding-protein-dependent transport systems inner membrane component [Halovivax asiaticus JCM 14624]